jgi:hypothetical protein
MTVAQINALYSTFTTAIDAEDYDGAIKAAVKAKFLLAKLPSVTRNLGGGGSQALAWPNAVAIDSAIAECRKLAAAASHATSGPFQQTPITYARPDDADSYE